MSHGTPVRLAGYHRRVQERQGLMNRCIIALLALVIAAPAAGQEWQVARERFTYVGTALDIDVEVESAGSIRLIRGEPGVVRVAGRAERGFTAAGLRDDDLLTLTAAGPGPVDYLVSVPEGVFVRVRLPGQPLRESVGSWDVARTFEWGTAAAGIEAAAPALAPAPASTGHATPSLFTTFTAERAPRLVALPDLSMIRSVTVRIEGQRFRVASSRPLAVEPGNVEHLVIRPAGPPLDLEIHVPEFTPTFTLRAGDATALTIDGQAVTALCTPLTEQRLSDGSRWFTFNPAAARLDCRTRTVPTRRG